MSQFNLDDPINPATKTGSILASDLSYFRDAMHTLHAHPSTSTRPSYAVGGTIWADTSVNPWTIYMYDGVGDIVIGKVDTTANTFLPNASALDAFTNIKQSATTGSSGVAELATQAEVDAGTDNTRIVTPNALANTTVVNTQYFTVLDTPELLATSLTPNSWTTINSTTLASATASAAVLRLDIISALGINLHPAYAYAYIRKTGTALAADAATRVLVARNSDTYQGGSDYTYLAASPQFTVNLDVSYDFDYYFEYNISMTSSNLYLIGYYS